MKLIVLALALYEAPGVGALDFAFSFDNNVLNPDIGGFFTGVVRGLENNATGAAASAEVLTSSSGIGIGEYIGNPFENSWTVVNKRIVEFNFLSFGIANQAPAVTEACLFFDSTALNMSDAWQAGVGNPGFKTSGVTGFDPEDIALTFMLIVPTEAPAASPGLLSAPPSPNPRPAPLREPLQTVAVPDDSLHFDFSFFNAMNGGGMVTGVIRGLENGVNGPATSVQVLTAPDTRAMGEYVGNPSRNWFTVADFKIVAFDFLSFGMSNEAPAARNSTLFFDSAEFLGATLRAGVSLRPNFIARGREHVSTDDIDLLFTLRTVIPTQSPTSEPSPRPTSSPTRAPTLPPSKEPTLPTAAPLVPPGIPPIASSAVFPTASPLSGNFTLNDEPVTSPTPVPMRLITTNLTSAATPTPSRIPAANNTASPTALPMVSTNLTSAATPTPTSVPAANTTTSPATVPMVSTNLTSAATPTPTSVPAAKTTASPTPVPMVSTNLTSAATPTPTRIPTANTTASLAPASLGLVSTNVTSVATPAPTATPTQTPAVLTSSPIEPTGRPTAPPTSTPTSSPTTTSPTKVPSELPTTTPTEAPTELPTTTPTKAPTELPTTTPTKTPTELPTKAPTELPTNAPTELPTKAPSELPTTSPTNAPTELPTKAPTELPTKAPTAPPSSTPTSNPTIAPTAKPTTTPTEDQTAAPSPAPQAPTSGTETSESRATDMSFLFSFKNTLNPAVGGEYDGIVRGLTNGGTGPASSVEIQSATNGFGVGEYVPGESRRRRRTSKVDAVTQRSSSEVRVLMDEEIVNEWTVEDGKLVAFRFSSSSSALGASLFFDSTELMGTSFRAGVGVAGEALRIASAGVTSQDIGLTMTEVTAAKPAPTPNPTSDKPVSPAPQSHQQQRTSTTTPKPVAPPRTFHKPTSKPVDKKRSKAAWRRVAVPHRKIA